MPFLSAIAGRQLRALFARLAGVVAAGGVVLLLHACGERGGEDAVAEPRAEDAASASTATGAAPEPAAAADAGALAPLLERAHAPGRMADADRQALEQAMQTVLAPAARACDGCRATVSYVDEPAGGDHFRCDVLGAGGELMADLELYHRPELPADAPRAWARSNVAGHPASALAGEHLFVWTGRFEIRAFGRAQSLRGEQALERLVAGLPLDALAKL